METVFGINNLCREILVKLGCACRLARRRQASDDDELGLLATCAVTGRAAYRHFITYILYINIGYTKYKSNLPLSEIVVGIGAVEDAEKVSIWRGELFFQVTTQHKWRGSVDIDILPPTSPQYLIK